MFNQLANARIYENVYSIKSKRIYARLDSKSDEILHKYQEILQPKGLINNFLALFDSDRQLKINCLEEILLLRNKATTNIEYPLESNSSSTSQRSIDVNLMSSDYDMKVFNNNNDKKKIHPYGFVLTRFLSRGYLK
jgi:hypothetical protein